MWDFHFQFCTTEKHSYIFRLFDGIILRSVGNETDDTRRALPFALVLDDIMNYVLLFWDNFSWPKATVVEKLQLNCRLDWWKFFLEVARKFVIVVACEYWSLFCSASWDFCWCTAYVYWRRVFLHEKKPKKSLCSGYQVNVTSIWYSFSNFAMSRPQCRIIDENILESQNWGATYARRSFSCFQLR